MLDKPQVDSAIDVQTKAYRLLRWVSEAIRKGFIDFGRVHTWTTAASSAAAWLREHFENVPPQCRPAKSVGPEFDRFVNYFASYLFTSFEIDSNPRPELRSDCGCYCPFCTYLAAGSHLKTKKLHSVDKKRAETLKRHCLEQLAIDNHLAVSGPLIERVLADADLSRAAALCAYVSEVIRRCKGLSSGPETLALWRQFAWRPTGSPIKDFKLNTKDVLAAQRSLVDALHAGRSA